MLLVGSRFKESFVRIWGKEQILTVTQETQRPLLAFSLMWPRSVANLFHITKSISSRKHYKRILCTYFVFKLAVRNLGSVLFSQKKMIDDETGRVLGCFKNWEKTNGGLWRNKMWYEENALMQTWIWNENVSSLYRYIL